jgi:predicted HTH transcriptional regulator
MVEVRIAAELSKTFPHGGPVCVTKAMSYLAVGRTTEITPAHNVQVSGVTTRSVERNIKKLQDAGKLRRVGPAKGGHWKVLG